MLKKRSRVRIRISAMPKWTHKKQQYQNDYVEYDLPDSAELALLRIWNVRDARAGARARKLTHHHRRWGRRHSLPRPQVKLTDD